MPPQQDFNRVAGSRLLKLVLALYRKQLVELPDAGHTDDILLLLRIANGDSELMAWASNVTGADAQELRKSCVAFVERICFSGDTNPFNVLGLNPWANADAVKEHYRLLIRIFHPDRGQVSNKVAEVYSARINQAYASLKLQVGDDSINLSERVHTSYRGQSGIVPRRFTRPVGAQNHGDNAMQWASKLTPAKVLFGLAVLAGLIIYLSFPQKMRMPTRAVNVVEKAQSPVPDVDVTSFADIPMPEIHALPEVVNHDAAQTAYAPEVKADVVPEQPALLVQADKVENVPTLTKPLVKTAPAPLVNNNKAKEVAVKPDTRLQTVKTVVTQSSQTRTANKVDTVQSVIAIAASNTAQVPTEPQANKKRSIPSVTESAVETASEIPVQPRIVTPKPIDVPTDRELHDIVTSFMNHYANGDINAFMQTFDEQVRSDEQGGRSGLYRAYADLFAKTASRSIVLKDLQWEKQGAVAVAQADYRASIQHNGETQMKSSSGTLQIEVVKRGGRTLISGFFYQDAQK